MQEDRRIGGEKQQYLLTPLSAFWDILLLVPLAWAGTTILTRAHYQWQRGRTYTYRFCHETREIYKTDVLLNTNVSPKAFILLLSLKYMKLRAVVSIIINMPSSLVRGLQRIFIFSSHINFTWWKAIQIIKCTFILLLLQPLQKDVQVFWIFQFFRIRSLQIFSTASTHEIRLTSKNFSSLSSAGRSPLYRTDCFVNRSSNNVCLPRNFRFVYILFSLQ